MDEAKDKGVEWDKRKYDEFEFLGQDVNYYQTTSLN